MRRSLHIYPPSGMAAIRQIPKYYKILYAPTEAKKNIGLQANTQNATRD